MKIKHEIEINANNPFVNCKLEREKYARVLTEIVSSYSDGFVLAINNEWGTGKTTFVKMWQNLLIKEEYSTIYFNAWENDFNSNPLVALMSELKPLIKGKVDSEKIFKSVIEKGAILAKNVAPALAKALVKKYIVDTDVILESVENGTKAATEVFEEEMKEFSEKKKTIIEFRKELQKFIKKSESDKPLIFIIDELDRCRPDYAVEVLEQLKHFFSVNGVVFILSIDKNHLASSVRGFYGSEHINTDEYLRRFIDLEYSIPKPSNELFCNYLFDYYELHEFFNSTQRRNYDEFYNDKSNFLQIAELLFDKTNATLRQQEKIFGQTRLILKSFKINENIFSPLLFILTYIKVLHNELYKKIESYRMTHQELCDSIINLFPLRQNPIYGMNLIYIVAIILPLYDNSLDPGKRIKLIVKEKDDLISSPIVLANEDDNKDFVRQLDMFIYKRITSGKNLSYLLNKINLTESFILN